MSKPGLILLCTVIIIGFIGCSAIKALSLLRNGTLGIQNVAGNVKFEKIGAIILVRVRISESKEELRFILDTGAFSCISKDIAARLNLNPLVSVRAKGASNKTAKTDISILKKVSIGSADVNDLGVLVVDMSPVERYLGIKVDGIIGNNFMRKFYTEINYENSSIILSPSLNKREINDRPNKIAFKTNIKYGFAPDILCKLNAIKCHAIIDNGFNGFIAIPQKLSSKIKINTSYAGKGSCIETLFGSNTECRMVVIDSFFMGGISFKAVPGIVMDCEDGLIGGKIAEYFNLRINYNTGDLYAEINKAHKNPEEICNSGLIVHVDNKNEKTIGGIWNLPIDSGLNLGDTIKSINGFSSYGLSGMTIDSLLTTCINSVSIEAKDKIGNKRSFSFQPLKICEIQMLR
jgi:predicted aspartyl protease